MTSLLRNIKEPVLTAIYSPSCLTTLLMLSMLFVLCLPLTIVWVLSCEFPPPQISICRLPMCPIEISLIIDATQG